MAMKLASSQSTARAAAPRALGAATPMLRAGLSRRAAVRVCAADAQNQVIKPINGDPFVGFLETPVTSAPLVASFLSNLPAYRTGVSPLLRGVEIGLAHGYLLVGPFIKLGPLRNVPGTAEIAGSLSGAGLVIILAVCLTIYGQAAFQTKPPLGVKTLSGRPIARDPLQTAEGWEQFSAGWTIGGLGGVGYCYILTQLLPYYS